MLRLLVLFIFVACSSPEYIRQPAQVLGGLEPDVIRGTLIENVPQFRYCYQKELDKSAKSFGAKTSLNFVISPLGRVTKALVTPLSEDVPESVRKCVQQVLVGITFPAPAGGGVVQVKQKINFYPKN